MRNIRSRKIRPIIESVERRLLMSASIPLADLATFVRAPLASHPLVIADATWTGAANDLNWSTPGNWQSNAVPNAGDSIELPDVGSAQHITLTQDITVGDVTFDGQYSLGAYNITLNGDITSNTPGNTIMCGLLLTHDTTVTTAVTGDLTVYSLHDGGNSVGLTKQGPGAMLVLVPYSYTGPTTVAGGTLIAGSVLNSDVTVDQGATLDLRGTIGALNNNGTLSLMTAAATGNVSFGAGSTFQETLYYDNSQGEIDGTLTASGSSVDLTGSTLDVYIPNPFTPPIGRHITLIYNQTGSPVTGTFAGLPEGAVKTIGGVSYRVSYAGGTSQQDVTLTVVSQQSVWTGAGNDYLWSDPANWQDHLVPFSGADIVISDGGNGSLNHPINVDVPITVGSLTLSGVVLTGQTITLEGNIFVPANALILNPLTLTHDTTFGGQQGIILLGGSVNDGGHHYGISVSNHSILAMIPFGLDGSGDLVPTSDPIASTYTGDTQITGAILVLEGTLASSVRYDAESTFIGSGEVPSMSNADPQGFSTLGVEAFNLFTAPLPGTLIVDQDLQFNMATDVQVILGGTAIGDGTTAASSSNLHVLAGSIDLGNAIFSPSLSTGYAPANGDVITLISNDTGSAITGTFRNLPEGATVNVDNQAFKISYQGGGNQNDVTLTAIAVATKLVIDQQPADAAAGETLGPITVEVDDAHANLFSTNAAITLSSNGPLHGTLTVNAVNGIATFDDISIKQAGDYTLYVSAEGLNSDNSHQFTITPAQPATLVITHQPFTSARAKESIGNIEVDIHDAYGNLIADDASDVTLSAQVNGEPADEGVLAGTTTVTAENGVAVFSDLTITQKGTFTLTAEDGDLESATTGNLAIAPGPFRKFMAIAGKKIPPIIINTLAAFPDAQRVPKTVTVRIDNLANPGKAVLIRTIPVKRNNATISNLSFNKAGDYTMTIFDKAGDLITNDISIPAAPPAQLVFSTQPNFIDGHSAVTVSILDSYNNLTGASDETIVALAAAPRPAIGSHPTLGGTLSAAVIHGVATFPDVTLTRTVRDHLIASSGTLRHAWSNVFNA